MKRFASIGLLAAFALPAVALGAMSPAMMGAGSHGYDFMIGSWACTNSMPASQIGGPTSSTFAIAHAGAGLSIHASNNAMGYLSYAGKSKTWWNPTVYSDGSYSYESTRQSGAKTVWNGSFFDASSGKSSPIRDTYTFLSPTKQTDVTQTETGGTWKTVGNSTCTKS